MVLIPHLRHYKNLRSPSLAIKSENMNAIKAIFILSNMLNIQYMCTNEIVSTYSCNEPPAQSSVDQEKINHVSDE